MPGPVEKENISLFIVTDRSFYTIFYITAAERGLNIKEDCGDDGYG